MKSGSRAFTLVELLAVIVIVAILAALLFPVFRAAKGTALRAACISNYHQAQLATTMYLSDYDDHFMLVNYHFDKPPVDSVDRTWVQLLLPYVREFETFQCPSDFRNNPKTDAVIDIDLAPGDAYDRYYQASLLSNLGYNYLYLCPASQLGGRWIVQPRTMSQIADSESMLLFVDTIHTDKDSGKVGGGGSYIVVPPCRYTKVGLTTKDSFNLIAGSTPYTPTVGWTGDANEKYGRAWPWHLDQFATTVRVGGSTRSLTMKQLGSGCEVEDAWAGYISDSNNYPWDLD
jgi:prepilin-type N-terminal cleavage/methylation domain-containing protein